MARELTIASLSHPQEVAFVVALFELGGAQHGAAAAVRAGYATDEAEGARVAAHLLSSSRISGAIAGETKARFGAAASTAFRTLVDICATGRSETARISAAQEILNRGIGPVPSRSVSVTARVSIEDMIARLDGSSGVRPSEADGVDSPLEIEHGDGGVEMPLTGRWLPEDSG
jgi:hypothetical protein